VFVVEGLVLDCMHGGFDCRPEILVFGAVLEMVLDWLPKCIATAGMMQNNLF
jgi:hypothetical protein